MILKQAKRAPFLSKLFGGLVIAEGLAFGASYFVWSKLNKNRDLREKCRKDAPWVLELYYKMGETINSENRAIRIEDERHWARRAVKVDELKSN